MNGVKKDNTTGVSNGFGPKTPFLIGVAGGTASGKSTVCKRIMEKLGQDDIDHSQRRVVCISQDAFYRPLNEEESAKALKGAFNFDHPEAFDTDLILKTLKKIQAGEICNIPDYDFVTNSRLETQTTIYPADVVLFEGILMFYQKEIRDLFHMKLFVDSDADTRLARRVMRDTRERGRNLENVLSQYTKLVKPAFEEFCLPTKKFADVIIPRGAENTVAINLIVLHITEILHIDLSTNKSTSSNATGRQENSTSATSCKVFGSVDESSCAATATLNEIILASSCAGPPVLSPSSAKNQPLHCGQQPLDSPHSVGAGGK